MASKSPRDEYLSKSLWCLISMWSCMLIFFLFFLIPLSFLAKRLCEASSAGLVWGSHSGKSCIPSRTSWHATRPADQLQGQGVRGCCCTAGQDVFGRLWFFRHVCGANAYVDRSSSLWGCHGSFSLTFPGCANKQLQTDGADDTANGLRFAPCCSGVQYRPKQTEINRGTYLTL